MDFQGLECLLALGCPFELRILVGQVMEWRCYVRKFRNESSVVRSYSEK